MKPIYRFSPIYVLLKYFWYCAKRRYKSWKDYRRLCRLYKRMRKKYLRG